MSSVSRSALDQHIDRSPRCYSERDLAMWEGFSAIATSSTFALNDTTLAEHVAKFHSSWGTMIGAGHVYLEVDGKHSHDTRYFFRMGNAPLNSRQKELWEAKKKAKDEMKLAYRALLDHIRLHYVEVDLTTTDDAFQQEWNTAVQHAKKRATS